MNKILSVFLVLILIFLVSGCTSEIEQNESEEITASAGNSLSCPRGLVNDPYPGVCHLYTDENSNNICDYSE
jgi:ABC-type molybdate transport system substrate-binding protein